MYFVFFILFEKNVLVRASSDGLVDPFWIEVIFSLVFRLVRYRQGAPIFLAFYLLNLMTVLLIVFQVDFSQIVLTVVNSMRIVFVIFGLDVGSHWVMIVTLDFAVAFFVVHILELRLQLSDPILVLSLL